MVVSIAHVEEVTDDAVLGSVVEVVSSNPAVGYKYFSAFTGIDDLLSLHINLQYKSVSISNPM